VLVAGEACGNPSNRDARLRWSRPGIACEPVLPTPAMMRPHRTGWASRRGKARRHVSKRKDLDVLPAKVGSSSCGEALDRPHPREPDRSEQNRLAFNRRRRRWRQETTDRTHATDSIPFGSGCQALVPQQTRLTIRLVGKARRPRFRKGIFLTHFTQPQASSRRTAQFSILLRHARPRPRNVPWPVRTPQPTATGHTLPVGDLQ
jgi:hypothetical protein